MNKKLLVPRCPEAHRTHQADNGFAWAVNTYVAVPYITGIEIKPTRKS